MRAVIQRVRSCSVDVEGEPYSQIGKGLLVLLGIKTDDTQEDIHYLVDKIQHLRIFEDEEGKMNLSLNDIEGEVMIVSQFTLYGDCKKGRRPSFIRAGKPEEAECSYNEFVQVFRSTKIPVKTGVFQAHMNVRLDNDGPVTMLIDSEKSF
ncbi:D-aminoacyl-tRNA deacylase [Alkalibaculum bacchi]|uniref:D-aminoacyl-tRNA deacylase n=1 Tax=Alkalibaculum bacchi TaxID=645887 RepID=UPI0026ECC3E7|nr:D-aminoacyl-tRNA deacylase [Alkalibaculum bacchi]